MVRVQWDTGSHFLNQTPWGSEEGREPHHNTYLWIPRTPCVPDVITQHVVLWRQLSPHWYSRANRDPPHKDPPKFSHTYSLTFIMQSSEVWVAGLVLAFLLSTCIYGFFQSSDEKKTWKENTWQCYLCVSVHRRVAHLFHHTFVSHIQGFPLLSTLEPHSGLRKTLFRTGNPGSGGWKVHEQTKWVPLMKDQQVMTYDLFSSF